MLPLRNHCSPPTSRRNLCTTTRPRTHLRTTLQTTRNQRRHNTKRQRPNRAIRCTIHLLIRPPTVFHRIYRRRTHPPHQYQLASIKQSCFLLQSHPLNRKVPLPASRLPRFRWQSFLRKRLQIILLLLLLSLSLLEILYFCISKDASDTERKFESFMKEIEEEMENQEQDGEFFGKIQSIHYLVRWIGNCSIGNKFTTIIVH